MLTAESVASHFLASAIPVPPAWLLLFQALPLLVYHQIVDHRPMVLSAQQLWEASAALNTATVVQMMITVGLGASLSSDYVTLLRRRLQQPLPLLLNLRFQQRLLAQLYQPPCILHQRYLAHARASWTCLHQRQTILIPTVLLLEASWLRQQP